MGTKSTWKSKIVVFYPDVRRCTMFSDVIVKEKENTMINANTVKRVKKSLDSVNKPERRN